MNSAKRLLTISVTLLILVFAFQNCADHQGMDLGDDASSTQAPLATEGEEEVAPSIEKACLLNPYFSDLSSAEMYMASGRFIEAYASQSVPAGTTCVSEKRYCQNGNLSGSHPYSRCVVSPTTSLSCNFNGSTLTHGQTVVAYENSLVNVGSICQSQTRVCQNGVLSGQFQFSSCAVKNATSCSFNGTVVANGASVTAYLSKKDSSGLPVCLSEQRVCNNGFLTGSYSASTCQINYASCQFSGMTVVHGESVLAYQSGIVPAGSTCQREYRTCQFGLLSGSYLFSTCSVSSGGGGGGGGKFPGGPINDN